MKMLLLFLFLLSGCSVLDATSLRERSSSSRVPPASPTPVFTHRPFADSQKSLRIATWNVRNLFDTVDDPYADEVLTEAEYVSKLGELAQVLDALEADFVGLQEVENLQALRDLNDTLTKPYPQLGLLEGNDHQRGIDVAFLSRIPVVEVISHKKHNLPSHPDVSKGYRFSRDCLEVRLATDPACTVLLNHFKSSRGDAKKSAAKRRVQAEGVVEVLTKADVPASRVMIVLGDFNDRPESWALEPLFSQFHDPFAGVPKKERITHRYRKSGSALDHILLDEDGKKLVGEPKIWSSVARQTSDHNPLSVELRLQSVSDDVPLKVWGE